MPAVLAQDRPDTRNNLGSALLIAVSLNDFDTAKTLLELGADTSYSEEPTHEAALQIATTAEMVELLLSHGADIHLRTAQGGTPLHTAQNAAVAQCLLKHGADVTLRSNTTRTALHTAATHHRPDVIEVLVRHGMNVDVLRDGDFTPLHDVLRVYKYGDAYNRQCNTARKLLELGADVHARTEKGSAPLHIARGVPLIQLLIAHGADVNVRMPSSGRMPLHRVDTRDEALALLAAGADHHAVDSYLMTPLHWAAMDGYVELIEFYLDMGKPIDKLSVDMRTPLYWASYAGRERAVRMLLERGANPAAVDNKGGTPLLQAKNVRVAELLLDAGTPVNLPDDDGMTPLHWASRMKRVEIVRLLIERGAELEARTRGGWTTLHKAVIETDNLEVITALLDAGCDVNATMLDGTTPLHRACDAATARLLLQRGANIHIRDKQGNLPFDTATKAGRTDVAELVQPVPVTGGV